MKKITYGSDYKSSLNQSATVSTTECNDIDFNLMKSFAFVRLNKVTDRQMAIYEEKN